MHTRELDARRAIWLFFLVLTVALAAAEIGTRTWVVRMSRIERRTADELQTAVVPVPNGRRSMMFVGNSLLLHAVDSDTIEAALPPGWTLKRLVVEQTYYLDWLYALPRLFRRGANPTVVAVMLDAGQLTANETRGDYAAYRLFGLGDAIQVGRSAGLHRTEISRLVTSNLSVYYGFRGESRKVLLSHVVPGMNDLSTLLIPRANVRPPDTLAIRRIAGERLRILRGLVEQRGARLVFLLPPGLGTEAAARAIRAAGQDAAVPVVPAFDPRDYTASDYLDGYHLNARGSARYTRSLIDALVRPIAATDH